MAVDKSKIILTFQHPRVTREAQKALGLKAFPDGHTYHIGQIVPTWREFMQALRPGDVVWVYAASMVPAPKKKVGGMSLPAQWSAFSSELHKAVTPGGYLIEGVTGLTTKTAKQGRLLHQATIGFLRAGGKRIATSGKAGRKPKEWPSEEARQAWLRRWKSKNYASDKAVIREAAAEGITERMIRNFGPSGRNG